MSRFLSGSGKGVIDVPRQLWHIDENRADDPMFSPAIYGDLLIASIANQMPYPMWGANETWSLDPTVRTTGGIAAKVLRKSFHLHCEGHINTTVVVEVRASSHGGTRSRVWYIDVDDPQGHAIEVAPSFINNQALYKALGDRSTFKLLHAYQRYQLFIELTKEPLVRIGLEVGP